MAKNRSRRLRKKMHIEEFQEVGFSVAWRFPEGTSVEQIDQDVDAFINDVIDAPHAHRAGWCKPPCPD